MMSHKFSRKRSVGLKVLAVGLASLMLVFAGSSNTALAGGDPPPGFTTVLVTGQATLCIDGKPIQGAKVVVFSKKKPDLKVETTTNQEGKFSVLAVMFGTHAQAALADLGIKFIGYVIKQMTSFVLSGPLGTFISINACLQGSGSLCPPLEDEFNWDTERKEDENDEDFANRIRNDLISKLRGVVDKHVPGELTAAQGAAAKAALERMANNWVPAVVGGGGARAMTFNVYLADDSGCVQLLSVRVHRHRRGDSPVFRNINIYHELGHTAIAKCIARDAGADAGAAARQENDPNGPQERFHQEFGRDAKETHQKMENAGLDPNEEKDVEKFMNQAVQNAYKPGTCP